MLVSQDIAIVLTSRDCTFDRKHCLNDLLGKFLLPLLPLSTISCFNSSPQIFAHAFLSQSNDTCKCMVRFGKVKSYHIS